MGILDSAPSKSSVKICWTIERERERERKKGDGWEEGTERESERKGVGGSEAHEARRRASSANHEAEACYVTGEGRAEENQAQTSEICCTEARTSYIPNEGRIPSWTYSKTDVYRDSSVNEINCNLFISIQF